MKDTIAAIATPAGSGGIGIIRISGPGAIDILNSVFIPQHKNSKPKPYLLRFGRIIRHNDSEVIDEVLAAYMPGPHSFTGEDVVEFYCHAGQINLKIILDNILEAGCRPAEAGEFSLRRFVNHNIDLSRLEGAAEMVAAKTDLAHRLSREHLLGNYGEYIGDLRNKIVRLLAELDADIDFPDEEDVGRIGRGMLEERIDEIIETIGGLAASYKTGKIIRDGFRLIILGPPNAGKSSLFNRLVRQNRALVTDVPGTTRDYLTEWIDLEGLPVEIFDTAGLREGRGKVERAGIAAAQDLIKKADLVIYMIDIKSRPSPPPSLNLRRAQHVVYVLNKTDLIKNEKARADNWRKALNNPQRLLPLSVKTGKGISELYKVLLEVSGTADLSEALVVTSQRHKTKLDRCLKHLNAVRRELTSPPEIISFELRQAADQISEITGNVYTEQILDEIFSSFCIGK